MRTKFTFWTNICHCLKSGELGMEVSAGISFGKIFSIKTCSVGFFFTFHPFLHLAECWIQLFHDCAKMRIPGGGSPLTFTPGEDTRKHLLHNTHFINTRQTLLTRHRKTCFMQRILYTKAFSHTVEDCTFSWWWWWWLWWCGWWSGDLQLNLERAANMASRRLLTSVS